MTQMVRMPVLNPQITQMTQMVRMPVLNPQIAQIAQMVRMRTCFSSSRQAARIGGLTLQS
jgi:hypothetical protein